MTSSSIKSISTAFLYIIIQTCFNHMLNKTIERQKDQGNLVFIHRSNQIKS